MKRMGVVGVVAALVTMLTMASAAAETPPGLLDRGDDYVCEDEAVVVFGGNGRSGWLGGQLYTAVSFEGTFTPTVGDPITFSKEWGKGPSGDTIECTQEAVEENGTWEAVVMAVKVPGH